MASIIVDHQFNNDLLLTKRDQELAASKYPAILHVLDHPELREVFSAFDKAANRKKRHGLILGLCAIGLVFIALVIASIEQLSHGDKAISLELAKQLALVSAGCGLLGVVIGGIGVLFAKRKRHWLYQRLMTERIRQFHFQTFVLRVEEILRSLKDDQAKTAFALSRRVWFETFKDNFVGKIDSEFTKTISDDEGKDMSLHEGRTRPARIRETKQLAALFRAYRELRIEHQLGYTNYKLTEDGQLLSAVPRSQAVVLSNVGFISVFGLCAVHIVILSLVLLRQSEWATYSSFFATLAIWFAFVALAVRAIEQGLQPEREVERYQQYRSGIKAIRERFDRADAAAEKLQIMMEMERLCYDEMRDFLITNDRSRFVM